MKKLAKILVLVMALSVVLSFAAACSDPCAEGHDFGTDNVCTRCGKTYCEVKGHNWDDGVCTVCNEEYKLVDYVSQCKLNMDSPTKKYTPATQSEMSKFIKMYVDGDTTHFNVETSDKHPEGVLKARYYAVNTPESTGRVEPWGKVASNYTKNTLQAAIDNGGAVLVEADKDDGVWANDSYGRTMAWIWYKKDATSDWRNLNLELLQLGLGFGSSVSENRYGEYCLSALVQAQDAKLVVFSKKIDELFDYSDAKEISIKELRTNFSMYELKNVAFTGYVTSAFDGTFYVQDYEDGRWYGIPVYYNGTQSEILKTLTVGNHVRVVGTAQDFNGTWQVSSLSHNAFDPLNPKNTRVVDDDTIEAPELLTLTYDVWDDDNKISIEILDEEGELFSKEFMPKQLMVGTSVTATRLYVYDTYTTKKGNSTGAMTLYCSFIGPDDRTQIIQIRTEVLTKKDPTDPTGLKYVTVTADEFLNHYIDVNIGVVDWFNLDNANTYQIRVFRYNDLKVYTE